MAPEPSLAAMRFSVDEIKSALSSKSSQGSKPTQTTAESAQSVPSDQNGVEKAKEVSADRKAMAADGSQPLSIIPAADPAPACAGLKDTSPGTCPVAANRKSASETEAQGSDAQGTADQNADGQIEHRRKPPSLYEPRPACFRSAIPGVNPVQGAAGSEIEMVRDAFISRWMPGPRMSTSSVCMPGRTFAASSGTSTYAR